MNAISVSEARNAIIDALRSAGKSQEEINRLSDLLRSDTGTLIIAAVIAAVNKS